ncbi:hypothetical protein ACLBWZ_17325 [Brucellaceae bacterium C25G]
MVTHTPSEAGLGNVTNKTEAQMVASGAIATALAGKAASTHNHTAAQTTAGVFDIGRIPNIPYSKITGAPAPWPGVYSGSGALLSGVWRTRGGTGKTGWQIVERIEECLKFMMSIACPRLRMIV